MPASRLSATALLVPSTSDMVAKKQLQASLDTVFFDKVLTPRRLDVELAKVDLERSRTSTPTSSRYGNVKTELMAV
ncbi:hypothetical protein CYMTET_47416 [Cymbomonas tetramitiformis]|uniref:Uncharacterized protein n=1 Tax=Cymbomonas tetramitiformis TaxID=36881 RepID=A0AAE0EW77_9CHLO|nr:hypothetical protein CYMTET_47416 [Cymbomonas tetramitiformis]